MRRWVLAAAILFVLQTISQSSQAASKVYTSTNFIIHYDDTRDTIGYARWIAESLEKAWDEIFGTLGYKRASWMEKYYIHVYIKPLGTGHGTFTMGVARYPKYDIGYVFRTPFIDINSFWSTYTSYPQRNANQTLQEMKATCGHEFFHIVQREYSGDELDWLRESTAVWIEDAIFKPPRRNWEYYGCANRYNEYDTHIPLSWRQDLQDYAASCFHQYLTERRPGGNDVVRKIWEKAEAESGENTFEAVAQALGDSSAWGPKMKARITDFGVAHFISRPQFHRTYSYEKQRYSRAGLSVPDKELEPSGVVYSSYRKPYVRSASRVAAQLTFDYVELLGESHHTLRMMPGRLAIALRTIGHEDWGFRLIQIPHTGSWNVKKLTTKAKGEWSVYCCMKDFPSSGRVVIAASNLSSIAEEASALRADRYELAAALLSAPVVERFEVREFNETMLSWENVWAISRKKIGTAGKWATVVKPTAGPRYQPGASIEVYLKTSRSMRSFPEIKIGEMKVRLNKLRVGRQWHNYDSWFEGNVGREFKGRLELEAFARELKEGKSPVWLPIFIKGTSYGGAHLDADPSTPVELVAEGKQLKLIGWEGDEITSPGGADTLGGNKLPLSTLAPAAYLAHVKVSQKSKKSGAQALIYEAKWMPGWISSKRRRLEVVTIKEYDPKQPASIELTFNREMLSGAGKVGPKVTLAGVSIPVRLKKSAAGGLDKESAVYVGEIPGGNPRIKKALEQNWEAKLAVGGYVEQIGSSGFTEKLMLDADPTTPARFDWKKKQWMDIQGDRPDISHKLIGGGKSVVVVLDASGSMKEGNRMAKAKEGIRSALLHLGARDEAALIVFYDCDKIKTVVPFTEDWTKILSKLKGIKPYRGTPLGDALTHARGYMKKYARRIEHSILLFSDGESTCGSDPLSVASKVKQPPPKATAKKPKPEPPSRSLEWWAYQVESRRSGRTLIVDVVEMHYREKTGKTSEAKLLVRRYPVSSASSLGRTFWSVNWAAGETERSDKATTADGVAALRHKAKQLRQGSIQRADIPSRIQQLLGPSSRRLQRR